MLDRSAAKSAAASWPLRLALGVALLTLAGCGGEALNLKKELGLVGAGPDEFTVVKRKPLALPPATPSSVEGLPAPRPGAPSPLDPNPEADAQRALTGQVAASGGEASSGEKALLEKAGASNADDSIRQTLKEDSENALTGTVVDDAVKDVVELVKGTSVPEGDPLDPAEEARRLSEKAKAEGKNPGLQLPPKED